MKERELKEQRVKMRVEEGRRREVAEKQRHRG